MAIKTRARPDGSTFRVLHLEDGRTFRFGRRAPTVQGGHAALRLRDYIDRGALPTPPAACDYTGAAASGLAQIYLNNTLGDCVVAGVTHTENVWTANANGEETIFTDAQISGMYSAACSYVPGNPNTDRGCDIQAVFKYLQTYGYPSGTGGKPSGFVAIDPTNWQEVQLAIWLFENIIFGTDLPDAWVTNGPNESGFVWDIAGQADPNNGHCYGGFGYNQTEVKIATWGMTGWQTKAAIAAYNASGANGELYSLLSQDQISVAKQVAPNGLNWAQLQADFAALGAPPSPTPPTPPAPPPSPPTPPVPPPAALIPGTAPWLQANLTPAALAAWVASLRGVGAFFLEDAARAPVGSALWMALHMSPNSYLAYCRAIESAGLSHSLFTDEGKFRGKVLMGEL
jgi:hypothetical protein